MWLALMLCVAKVLGMDNAGGGSSHVWFSLCKRCDLAALTEMGTGYVNTKGLKDETCLSYCVGALDVPFSKKDDVVAWLLESGLAVDNAVFGTVCSEVAWLQEDNLFGSEYFTMQLLAHIAEDKRASFNFNYGEALCQAARCGCVETSRQLLEIVKTADNVHFLPDLSDSLGTSAELIPTTALGEAILAGSIEICELLIAEGGASINSQIGVSPVDLALRNGKYDIAYFLLRLGGPHGTIKALLEVQEAIEQAKRARAALADLCETYMDLYNGLPDTFEQVSLRLQASGYTELEVRSIIHPLS